MEAVFVPRLTFISTRMLSNLEAGVDRTQTKLNGAMKRMQKFIRDTEGESLACYDLNRTNTEF